jgi:AraC-like DNA-binding protein
MKYWYQKPHASLTEYVRTILILEGFSAADANQLPLVTSGMPAFFYCCETDHNGVVHIRELALFGKSIPPEAFVIHETTTIVGYFFKPFALASVFNVAASDLIKDRLELSTWSPHKANALKTQLLYATSTSRKIEILDNLIIQELQENHKQCEIVRIATDEIMNNSNTEVLSALLNTLKLNERTFQRIFKKFVGVTPSHYRRICQFHHSFSQLRTKDFEKVTDVAFDNGFADQSHFIRSFKEFTQTTPNTYLKSGLKRKK